MTGTCLVLAKICIISNILFFVLGSIAVVIDALSIRKKERAALLKQQSEEIEKQTLTLSEIMELSDVEIEDLKLARNVLCDLGGLFGDNGDERVEVTNAASAMLTSLLRESNKK